MTSAPPPYEDYCEGLTPLQVEIRDGNFEEGLRRFKSLVQRSKILTEYKERQHYEKPSEKRRRERRQREERRRLSVIREKQMASGEWDRRQNKKDAKRRKRNINAYE